MTVYVEGDPKFDIMKCLAYPLKEYESLESIPLREHFINIDDKECEELRSYSFSRFLAQKHQNERNEERKQENTTAQQNLDTYLGKMFWEYMLDENGCLKDEYRDIPKMYYQLFIYVCEYHEDQKKLSWRWSDIRNHVLSFMFRSDQCNEMELIKFVHNAK